MKIHVAFKSLTFSGKSEVFRKGKSRELPVVRSEDSASRRTSTASFLKKLVTPGKAYSIFSH
jgi:hypothetical protein